jgi:ElaB protein
METSSRTLTGDGSQQTAVSHNLRHMVDEIDTFLKSAADTGDQRFNAVRDRLVEQVREMRGQIDELNQATLARVKRAARQADDTVHAHPYGAMGVAAAAGLLIGFLAARR